MIWFESKQTCPSLGLKMMKLTATTFLSQSDVLCCVTYSQLPNFMNRPIPMQVVRARGRLDRPALDDEPAVCVTDYV